MEKLNNEVDSDSSHNIVSSFATLAGILNSKTNTKEKCAAWRQQSLIVKCLDETLVNDLMQRHWSQHYSTVENSRELHKYIDDAVGNNEYIGDIQFPLVDIDIPIDHNASNNKFIEKSLERDYQTNEEVARLMEPNISNKNENSSWKKRSTIENFLQGHSQPKNQQPSFHSARQLLDVQILKKQLQSDGTASQKRNLSNNLQMPDVGFNFSATKKSLGPLGRLVNPARRCFVSPIRSKSITLESDANCEENVMNEVAQMLSHPALKNVDPKMVELINNEIIHKFKPVEWNEIAGLDYAKSIIKEAVVYPLLRPDIFTGLRRPPRGILLFGPPGTGKTLIGKCIASQSSSTFFSISSASLTSKWMGEGEKMVRALFAVAVARQPSVIFIDEIDSLLSQRSENENEGTRRLKTEFLVRLDGAATSDDDRVLIVGATNRPQELDEAVRRRFVKRLYVPLPDVDARSEILANLLKTVENNLNNCQVKEISQLAEGYSGADMDSLCREASMEPLRSLPIEDIVTFQKENLRHVNINDFYTALKKIRPSVSQSDLNQYVDWNKTYGSSF